MQEASQAAKEDGKSEEEKRARDKLNQMYARRPRPKPKFKKVDFCEAYNQQVNMVTFSEQGCPAECCAPLAAC